MAATKFIKRTQTIDVPFDCAFLTRAACFTVVPVLRAQRSSCVSPGIARPCTDKTASFEDIEKAFWRSMSTYKEAPLYGADVQGSLMGKSDCSGWHLDRLDTVLSQCAGKSLGGITRAMLYFGSWRAMFAWHKEDLDLYSINYLHGGAPKLWYAVPPPLAGRFEAMADGWFPQERMRCKEYLRHKTCMMSPSVLRGSNIACHTAST